MNLKDIVVLSESPEDEALLDKAESAFAQVRATTKNIKYDDTAIEILSEVGSIVDNLDVKEVKDEIEYLERALFDAKNSLESAVYELEAPFEDLIRTLKNKIDDEESDREWEQRYGADESILSAMTRPLGETVPLQDDKEKMIGEPDGFYDAEERIQAYNDLQDALQGNYMDDYIKDGSCPACAGSGYMDGEEEVWDDDEEDYVQGSECDGFGNYGCDEGEMTYGSDGPSWVEIMKHDKRQKQRAELAAKPQPSDDVLYKAAKLLHKQYVIDTNRYNAFKVPELLRQMYPEIPKHKAREIGGKVLSDYKAENKINSDMALIAEGPKSDNAVNTLVNMFYDILDKYSSEEELEAEVSSQASSLTRLLGDFDTGKATERAMDDLRDNSDFPGSIDRDYDARYEGIFTKHSYDPVAPGGQSSKRKNLHATGDRVSLDGKEYVVTKVDLDKGTVDVVDRDGNHKPDVKAGVFSPGLKVGDRKSSTIGNFPSDNRDPRLFDGKSPHKKGTKKYKKHMAAMHAGESITSGNTKNNVRLKELSPRRDNSANEMKVAELIRKALKDPQGEDAYDLYAELESENPELADLYKDVALNQYEVQLEEGIKDTLKKGAAIGGVIAMLLGINSMAPTAKDGELGQALKAHVLASGEDSDLAKHYYNALDVYADASDQRTLINLNIKFNPEFKTDRTQYDPSRTDVELFLRKQAKLPEPTNERKYRDQGAADVVVGANGKEYVFYKDKKMFVSTNTAEPGGPERVDISTKLGKDLLRRRRNQMARTEPMREEWTPKQAGKKYWWE